MRGDRAGRKTISAPALARRLSGVVQDRRLEGLVRVALADRPCVVSVACAARVGAVRREDLAVGQDREGDHDTTFGQRVVLLVRPREIWRDFDAAAAGGESRDVPIVHPLVRLDVRPRRT